MHLCVLLISICTFFRPLCALPMDLPPDTRAPVITQGIPSFPKGELIFIGTRPWFFTWTTGLLQNAQIAPPPFSIEIEDRIEGDAPSDDLTLYNMYRDTRGTLPIRVHSPGLLLLPGSRCEALWSPVVGMDTTCELRFEVHLQETGHLRQVRLPELPKRFNVLLEGTRKLHEEGTGMYWSRASACVRFEDKEYTGATDPCLSLEVKALAHRST